jgi:hypothetical protein
MGIGLAALATLLLLGSFAWREAYSQVNNVNRPECDGIFDFYFLLDRYVSLSLSLYPWCVFGGVNKFNFIEERTDSCNESLY